MKKPIGSSLSFIILLSVLVSCKSSKSLYIKNQTDKPVTLLVPAAEKDSFFSVENKKIKLTASGTGKKRVIHYDQTAWTDADKDQLSRVLMKCKLAFGKDTVMLDKHFKIERIGSIVNELYVQILPQTIGKP